jgi:branched-chain amino acid transport system ATP-binding protein
MSVPLLEIRGLRVHYGAIGALDGVDLIVDHGSIVALLGANGAGKSSVLRAISGLVRPSGGDILLEGRSIVGLSADKIARLGVAHVLEGRGIFPALTVRENLAVGGFACPAAGTSQKDYERVLELFPRLRERFGQAAGTLSGGEQQMLAIARALIARPRVLLLDEPSLGLAPQLVQTIFQIIRRINQPGGWEGRGEVGTAILLVEQNAHMALEAAQQGHEMEVGRIVMADTADKLAESPKVRDAYLGIV